MKTLRYTPIVAALVMSAGACAADDVAGERLYVSRCGGCHSLDKNRIGPKHRGVHGRQVGTVEGFDYSPALRGSDVVWNDESLVAWLTNPAEFIPGQRMFFRVGAAEDRADIIAYLRRVSAE